MSSIVAISDLHLDVNTAGVERFTDVSHTLRSAAQYAITHKADAFIFVGDLTDPQTSRSHRSVAELADVLHQLDRAQVQTLCIAGNHDVVEDGSGSCVLDVLRHVGGTLVHTRPSYHTLRSMSRGRGMERPICRLMALPFTPTSANYDPGEFVIECATAELTALQPELPLLVVGHLNLEGITVGSETTEMPRGRDVFWPLQELAIHHPDAFLLGGHYHTPQVYNGVTIIGSAARLRFDERDNEPGFLVLEI